MATLKFNRNGGQRVVDTVSVQDTFVLRKMLLEKAEKWKLDTVLSSLNGKDYKQAQELMFADEQLSKLVWKAADAQECDEQDERPKVINKTKQLKQEQQRQRELQDKEWKEKANLLRQKRAA